jgi:hypothetical protein
MEYFTPKHTHHPQELSYRLVLRKFSHWPVAVYLLAANMLLWTPAWSGSNLPSGFSSSGGSCFISASASEFAGIGVIFGLCLVALLIGLRLIINGSTEEEAIDKAK